MSGKQVILGMCGKYQKAQIVLFAESLRQTGYEGDAVFFIHDNPPGFSDFLKKFAIQAIEINCDLRKLRSTYNCIRYFYYYEYLKQYKFERVLLTDVADVVFQKNIFDIPLQSGLISFAETKKIGECSINSHWIKQKFSDVVMSYLKDKTIICSGFTIGDYDDILFYTKQMAIHMEPFISHLPAMSGYDQGVHNYLIWSKLLPRIFIGLPSGEVVAHLHYHQNEFSLSPNGVLGAHGKIIPVLHQYNRHPQLINYLYSRYAKNK